MFPGIQVTREGTGRFRVEVTEGGGRSVHRVTVSESDRKRFGEGVADEVLVDESFRFLLEREPKESILGSFDLGVIARYFSEYPEEIRRRLRGRAAKR